jgi:hypothetical protein
VRAVVIKVALVSAMLLAATALVAGDKDKPAGKLEPQVVDSGSFGIFFDGKRVGTETFKIEQRSDYSIATAQIKVDDGKTQAEQSAEMQINPNGDLRSYAWKSTLPTHEEASVEPNDQLLMEHLVPADQKKMDMPHLLPLSTTILDDNFFSQREILMWRYLATACVRQQNNQLACGPGNFGVLVPHQHAAFNVTVQLQGQDKVEVKAGVQRQLNKILLKSGDPQRLLVMNSDKEADTEWVIWLDDQYKVIKISIPGARVEVIRD